ncbi:hypothetical protein Tco_1015063 [Tanacetum coccineum]|uniref:Uncharacterized protein n=1 Tax=Tanacetum coccineum TaxID=301880 RepID=A0ABQ5FJR0_9ASTR
MFWHTARDDTMFTSMRCISKHADTQVYCTIIPKELTNQAMLESKAYQTYFCFCFWRESSETKVKADLDTSPKKKTVQATKGTRLKSKAKVAKSDKKKQPTKMPKAKGLNVLSKSKVPDEQQQKVTGINEGSGVTPEVSDVPKYDLESEEESWTFSQDDKDAEEDSDRNDDSEETESDNDGDDLTHPNLSTYKADEEEEEEKEEKADDEEVDLNINLERSDAEMTDAQANQDTEDTHVTLTTVPPVVQQQSSSVSSDLVSKFTNPSLDIGIDSILNQDTQSDTLVNVPVSVAAKTPSSATTIPQPPIPNIQPLQQTPTSTTTTTTNPTITLLEIPNFASLF